MRNNHTIIAYHSNLVLLSCSAGFVEKEIKKANIPIMDTGENPEVPFPRDMIDLEVILPSHAAL